TPPRGQPPAPRRPDPSLHDALPICWRATQRPVATAAATSSSAAIQRPGPVRRGGGGRRATSRSSLRKSSSSAMAPLRGVLLLGRSEEHTSELQSRENLVCRLLLEKK